MRGACQRHLNDLAHAEEKGFFYDTEFSREAVAFYEEVLKLAGGTWEGKPFLLLPWQGFIVASLFGWKRTSDNMRRFRVAYIEAPKGAGKSPIAAGIGLKGLCADKESRAFIFAAATKRDQAMILFRDAVACVEQSPLLKKRLLMSGLGEKCWNLSHLESGSFFRVVSAEKKGLSGERPHIVLLDEIHEHPDGAVIESLRAGFKTRTQPLSFMITNSGSDKNSVCWEYHEMGRKIACEQIVNDEFFAYICSLDEEDTIDDKHLTDESLWAKVNPSLENGLPGYDYIRGQVLEAKGMPSKMSTVKRLCFCQWTEADNPWITADTWIACRDTDFDEELLLGRRCVGGLDLSSVQDLTSFVLMFEPTEDDPFYRLKPFFWLPGDNLIKKGEVDHVPYDVWKRDGNLFALDGAAINKSSVVKFISECSQKYDLTGIAYDRDRIKDLMEFAEKAGIELSIGKWDKEKRKWNFENTSGIKMMPFGQTSRSMAPALDKFEVMMVERQFKHNGNPVMTWCAANAVAKEDEDGYRKISKQKSSGRVDGVVAAVMACGILEDTRESSVYTGLTETEIIGRMSY